MKTVQAILVSIALIGVAVVISVGIEKDLVAGHLWLSVYLESSPTDERIREILSFCVDEMNPEEFEQAEARFAEWKTGVPK